MNEELMDLFRVMLIDLVVDKHFSITAEEDEFDFRMYVFGMGYIIHKEKLTNIEVCRQTIYEIIDDANKTMYKKVWDSINGLSHKNATEYHCEDDTDGWD